MNGEIGEVQSVAVNSHERLKGWVQAMHAEAWHKLPWNPISFIVGPLTPILEIGFEHSEIEL
jgi:hypothetical protein